MNNFDAVLKMAIETYAEISGEKVEDIIKECQNFESQKAKNVQMLMFAVA